MEDNTRACSVVKRCLYDEVPPQRVAQVAAWAINQDGEVCGVDLKTLKCADDLPSKRELGRQIYDAYRSVRHIPIKRHLENIKSVLEYLSVERLRCENYAALRQHDERLASDLDTYVKRFLWKNEFLHNQEIDDIPYVGNTIFLKSIEPNLTDRQRERLDERLQNGRGMATDVRTLSREQMRSAIIEHLKAHRTTDFTYGQLAERIGCKHQYAIVQSLLAELAKDLKSGVVFLKKAKASATQKKGDSYTYLWKYAPERKIIMTHPEKRDETLEALILQHLAENEEADATTRSGNGIRIAMRATLGKVSNEKVDAILTTLVEEEKVTVTPGFRRGNVYSLAKKMHQTT